MWYSTSAFAVLYYGYIHHILTISLTYWHNIVNHIVSFHNKVILCPNYLSHGGAKEISLFWLFSVALWCQRVLLFSSYGLDLLHANVRTVTENRVIIYVNHMWSQCGGNVNILWQHTVNIFDNRIVKADNVVYNIFTIPWHYSHNMITMWWTIWKPCCVEKCEVWWCKCVCNTCFECGLYTATLSITQERYVAATGLDACMILVMWHEKFVSFLWEITIICIFWCLKLVSQKSAENLQFSVLYFFA